MEFLTENQIYLGDAYALLPQVKPQSVRLLVTDIPYNITRKNNFHTMGRHGIEFDFDGEFDQISWLPLAAETLVPWGSIIIWNDWRKMESLCHGLEQNGFIVKRDLCLSKSNPKPANRNRVFVQTREYGVWAIKKGKTTGPKWIFNRRPENGMERGEFKYSVQKHQHPTKKPDKLFVELIEILSDPGDLILDPFCGAGTAAYAAEVTGRRHLSFEKDPNYYQLSLQHWEKGKQLANSLHQPKSSI